MRVAQAKRPGQLEGENARLRGRWPTRWPPTRSLGEAAEGTFGGRTRRRRAVTQAQRALAVPGGMGPAGCWASPAPAGVAVLVGRDSRGGALGGRELWGRLVGLGRSRLSAVSLPCRRVWGLDGLAASGWGSIWRQGARGAAPTAQGGAVCGRPAGPGSGCALPTAIHVWAHPVWLAAQTHQRAALAAADRGRRVHPAIPSDQGGPAHPGRQVCSPASRSCSIAYRVSRAPEDGQRTPGSPTGPCRPA